MKKTLGAVGVAFVLAGCDGQYRYPCQDPVNWDNAECKPPICEVNRDCPEYIFKENPRIELPSSAPARPAPPPPVSKGECK